MATFQLATEYLRNSENQLDREKASQLMLKLAKKGHVRAQMQLGLLYLFGDAQDLNSEEGFFWLKESAMQDFAPAQHNLGTMYAQGIGGESNLKHAYSWLKIASASIALAEVDSLIIREKMSENELRSAEILIDEITAQIANGKEL